jgi:hypothetical protein
MDGCGNDWPQMPPHLMLYRNGDGQTVQMDIGMDFGYQGFRLSLNSPANIITSDINFPST